MLGNKLLNIQFAKYHIWNNKSEGFPNMVLSTETFNQSVRTEYSEAVNARYTFQPLWVSDFIIFSFTSYREDIFLQTLLLLFKFVNHRNKRPFVLTANWALVGTLGSLSSGVFETRTATGGDQFAFQDTCFPQIFILIISNGEKKLSNVNVVV